MFTAHINMAYCLSIFKMVKATIRTKMPYVVVQIIGNFITNL